MVQKNTVSDLGNQDPLLPNLVRVRRHRHRGRPRQQAAQQRNRVVKTNLTGAEYTRLEADFRRVASGRRTPFAEFIRQRLLSTDRVGEERTAEACRLDTLLLLQDCRDQLRRTLVEKPRFDDPPTSDCATPDLGGVLARLETTLTRLTEWWFA